ncbi:MAG: T6SS effector BTH_I2691 family protein, partial [Stenotrophomonas sp.]
MTCDPSKICPICDQKGLPVLPVRYNVANVRNVHPNARPKALAAPFSASQIPLPSGTAQYTMRTLREGYLYTYHQKRNEWKGYVISGDGNFLEFRMGTKPPSLDGAEPCSRMSAGQTGRYIVIPDAHRPEALGKFWMCFSPVAWTRSTWKAHDNESYRNRHMRCIDLAEWVRTTGASQPHVAGFYAAMAQVADFHLASGYSNAAAGIGRADDMPTLGVVRVLPGDLPFEHSVVSAASNLRREQVDQLSAQMRYVAGQIAPMASGLTPILVAVDDPIAMTADLNQLVLKNVADWQGEPDRKEKFETAQLITALRASVQNGAVVEEQEWRRTKAVAAGVAMRTIFGRAHTSGMIRPEDLDSGMFNIEDVREIQRLGGEGWEKYKKHLVAGRGYEEYLEKTYPDELKRLAAEILDPLDASYISWFDSVTLHECMECNFDSDDISSGVQYQDAVCAMLNEATGRVRVFNFVCGKIKEDPAERRALIMRALAWNNDSAIRRWNEIANQPAGPAGWAALGGGLFNALKEVVEKGAAGELSGFMGGIAKYL